MATKAAPVAPKPVAVPKTIAHDRIIVVPGNTTTVAASPPPAPDSQAALVKTYNGNIFTMDNIPSSLANSVFYEYYRAGASGNATVSAWSSDAQQYYSTVCSSDGTMVSCYPQGTSNRYATVQFSQNAVDVHPPDQAAAYAASGHAGPNG